jgi:small conductance mechanosensitive channel
MNSTVTNYSSRETRRTDLTFSVAHGSEVEKVKNVIKEVVETYPKAHKIPAPIIRLEALKESSIDFLVRVWSDGSDMWDLYYELLEYIYKALVDNNITVPFKQVDVHIKKEDKL